MAVVFGALAALVFCDFAAAFLAEITHGFREKVESIVLSRASKAQKQPSGIFTKAESLPPIGPPVGHGTPPAWPWWQTSLAEELAL